MGAQGEPSPQSQNLPHIGAAQTNLALYRQLHELGYTLSMLRAVKEAHDFMAALTAGRFRASGKPFLAHLIGTASILAAIGAPPPVVIAGLAHAAYTHGDFGLGFWRSKRARLTAVIGAEAEALIWGYTERGWDDAAMRQQRAEIASGARPLGEERSLLQMRLANELEDHIDGGTAFFRAAGGEDALEALARDIGELALAAGFAETRRQSPALWTEGLLGERTNSYWLAWPGGLALLTPPLALRRWLRRALRSDRSRR